ncbi:MAG: hypothetical protein MJ009_07275 [Paludibacteraceae bacterium]|nr:hypothetical protein [Paludibacteraceae bacterium]
MKTLMESLQSKIHINLKEYLSQPENKLQALICKYRSGDKDLQKYIICDSARGKWGKTRTTNYVIDILESLPNATKHEKENIGGDDRYAEFTVENLRIAVVTQGDPNSNQLQYLNIAKNQFNADIIICTSRSYGSTVDNVLNVADNQYEVIWYKNFHQESSNISQVVLDAMSATGVLKLAGLLKGIDTLIGL